MNIEQHLSIYLFTILHYGSFLMRMMLAGYCCVSLYPQFVLYLYNKSCQIGVSISVWLIWFIRTVNENDII